MPRVYLLMTNKLRNLKGSDMKVRHAVLRQQIRAKVHANLMLRSCLFLSLLTQATSPETIFPSRVLTEDGLQVVLVSLYLKMAMLQQTTM